MENILHSASVPRNKLLFNHGINLLPYTGAGSGIARALKYTPGIKFVNDEILNEFVVTVERKNVEDDVEVDVEVERQTYIPYKLLFKTQKDTIQYCSIARTYKEILAYIGYKYNSKYLESLVRPLIKMGYLKLTVPDKPNSKNQKYRKAVSYSHSVTPPKDGLN